MQQHAAAYDGAVAVPAAGGTAATAAADATYLKPRERCAMVAWMLWQVVTSPVLEPEGIGVRLHRCAFDMQRCPLIKHAQGCTSMHMQ